MDQSMTVLQRLPVIPLLLLAGLLVYGLAWIGSLPVRAEFDDLVIERAFLEDAAGEYTINTVGEPSVANLFQPFEGPLFRGNNLDPVWMRLVVRPSEQPDWQLMVQPNSTHHAEVWLPTGWDEEPWRKVEVGSKHPHELREIRELVPSAAVKASPQFQQTIYVRVVTPTTPVYARVVSRDFGLRFDSILHLVGGLFVGVGLLLSVGAGQNRARLLELSSTGSIIPGELAGRLSVFTQSRDGHLFNRFDGTNLNDLNRQAVRGQLLWTPRDDLLVRVIGEYGDLNQRCCAIGLLGPVSASIQASDDYMGYERPGTNPADREIDNNVDPLTRLRREAASVVVEWGPAGRHRFVSITGVNQLRFNPARNDDGTSMNLVEGSTTTQSRQISQELRMHTRFHRMETTLGAIAVQQDLKGREVGVLGDEIALWALGGALRQQVPTLNRQNSGFLINAVLPPQALNGLRLITPYSQDSLTTSLFGNADWHLSPTATFSAGLRYTESRRNGRVARTREGGNLNSSPLALTNQLAALGGLLGPDFQDLTYDGLIDSLVGESFDRTDSRKDSGVGGQLGYQLKLAPGTVAYSTLTRGYKSGGLNLAGLTPQVRPQFDAETVTALEFGLRGVQAETGLAGGVAVYRSRVKNFQALSYDEGDGLIRNPRQNNVLNIPVVDMAGIELDFIVPVTKSLLAGGGLAYNRAVSTRFTNAPNEDTGENNKDLSGMQLYNAPRWSGFASLEKRFALVAGLQPYVGVEHSFRSKTFGAVDQSRNSFIDAYQLTNLRVGVRGNNGQWNLQAFLMNAFDEDYITAVAPLYSVGDYGGFAGEPRTFGVRLDMTLGP